MAQLNMQLEIPPFETEAESSKWCDELNRVLVRGGPVHVAIVGVKKIPYQPSRLSVRNVLLWPYSI